MFVGHFFQNKFFKIFTTHVQPEHDLDGDEGVMGS